MPQHAALKHRVLTVALKDQLLLRDAIAFECAVSAGPLSAQ